MTAKAHTDLEMYQKALLDNGNTHDSALPELVEEDHEDHEDLPQRFYDYIDHYHQLRHERGDMPDVVHKQLLLYLVQLLRWLLRAEEVAIEWEFNFYETGNYHEKPLYTDLFVFKRSIALDMSFNLEADGPPPEFILEIISRSTRSHDIGTKPEHKPQRYEKWGVSEYFAYDPRLRIRKNAPRLWGWRMVDGHFQQLVGEGPDGRMWSEQLQSWLVPDGTMLRLYDKDGQMRLTGEEAAQRHAAEERQAREVVQQENERLAQRLRELGEDPDKYRHRH